MRVCFHIFAANSKESIFTEDLNRKLPPSPDILRKLLPVEKCIRGDVSVKIVEYSRIEYRHFNHEKNMQQLIFRSFLNFLPHSEKKDREILFNFEFSWHNFGTYFSKV